MYPLTMTCIYQWDAATYPYNCYTCSQFYTGVVTGEGIAAIATTPRSPTAFSSSLLLAPGWSGYLTGLRPLGSILRTTTAAL